MAWADIATSSEVAHALVECNNSGTCNETLGVCMCSDGFEVCSAERISNLSTESKAGFNLPLGSCL